MRLPVFGAAVVKLIDVSPGNARNPEPNPRNVRMGGYEMLLIADIFGAKFRNSFSKPEPMIPNRVTRIAFELGDRYHTFLKDHRIMVQVQSSWFPMFDRNPQTFVDIYHAEAADRQIARERVYRSGKRGVPSGADRTERMFPHRVRKAKL